MASIYDVAQRCGLSTATVSRVLNNSEKVSPAAVQKVREAMQKLDYSANQMARDLATHSSHTIGLLTDDLSFTVSTYVFQCIRGIQHVLHAAGYCVALLPAADCSTEKCREHIKSHRIEGILAVSEYTAHHVLTKLAEHPGCPVGYIGAPRPDHACNVYSGYARYTCDILKRFAAFGHQRVLIFFLSETHKKEIQDQLYAEDSRFFPRNVDMRLVRESMEQGRAEKIMAIVEEAVVDGATAILCSSPLDVGPILSVCARLQLRIPHNLSLVTVEYCQREVDFLPIPVDSFQLPAFQMGEEIARLLLKRIQGSTENTRTEMMGTYIERGSVAFAPEKYL